MKAAEAVRSDTRFDVRLSPVLSGKSPLVVYDGPKAEKSVSACINEDETGQQWLVCASVSHSVV